MSLLIDQNLPSDLERHLAREFPGCVHVRSLGLERATDTFLWELAKERGLAILTKDLDFRHRSSCSGIHRRWFSSGAATARPRRSVRC